jgi:hypothetical protein
VEPRDALLIKSNIVATTLTLNNASNTVVDDVKLTVQGLFVTISTT